MRNLYLLVLNTFIAFILGINVIAIAAPNSPPGDPHDPNSRMYTIEDVYNLAARIKHTEKNTGLFVFPAANQNSDINGTGRTLNDVYEMIRTRVAIPKPTGTNASPTKGHGVPWPNPRFTIKQWGAFDDSDQNCTETDDTVVDNLTKLEWRRTYQYIKLGEAFSDPIVKADEQLKIQNLIAEINRYNAGAGDGPSNGKYNNWRVPTPKELFTLCDPSYYSPAMPDLFGTGKASQGSPFVYKSPPGDAKTNIGEKLWLTTMISERPYSIGYEEHVSLYSFSFEYGIISTVDTMWIDYAQAFCVRNITEVE